MEVSYLKTQRGRLKATLTRIINFVEEISDSTTIESLKTRLDKVNESWKEFMNIQDQLCHTSEGVNEQEVDTETESFENKYFWVTEILLRQINQRKANQENVDRLADQQANFLERLSSTYVPTTSHQESFSEPKLPKIHIPPFSGNYNEWISFRDLYTATIHNQKNLSASQKFHYLKGFLKEDAAALLRHVAVSEENYYQAWERLNKRYDKRGLITRSFIKTFNSLPKINNASAEGLRRLTDGADEVIRGLKALGNQAEARDPWLIFLILNKIDPVTRQDWSEEMAEVDFPTFDNLLNFLEKRCSALEEAGTQSTRQMFSSNKQVNQVRHIKTMHSTSVQSSSPMCPKCKDDHRLFACSQFKSLDIGSRQRFINENKLCYNCLQSGHTSQVCTSKYSCHQCARRHHTLLHSTIKSNWSQNRGSQPNHTPGTVAFAKGTKDKNEAVEIVNTITNTHTIASNAAQLTSLLPTAIGEVADVNGNKFNCRILLDSGSEVSFITENFVRKLNMKRNHARVAVIGLSSVKAGTTRGMTTIRIYSKINKKFIDVDVFILPKLTAPLPSASLPSFELERTIPQLSSIQLANPNFNESEQTDILLGSDVMFHILEDSRFEIVNTSLIAQLTIFGWIIAGKISTGYIESVYCNCNSVDTTVDIDQELQKFWELDTLQHEPKLSEDEILAEQHFTNTVSRNSDGRYIVKLPFKNPLIKLGDTYETAVKRLLSMEKRFGRNKNLFNAYQQFIHEYLQLKHMERVPEHEIENSNAYYLPHHAIIKPDSSTTKLRVVFDGSSPSSSGKSLNDALLIGPPILRELFTVCLRFRSHQYVFTADVEKMYRQILISKEHVDYQRILWRASPNEKINHFRLLTVTYGTSAAPFLAIRTLHQLAKDYEQRFPKAAATLLRDCYVDDIITGASSVKEILILKNEVMQLLSLAGLNLRKWTSNCWAVLTSCNEEDCELDSVEFKEDRRAIKTLGLHWYPHSDTFSFKALFDPDHTPITKRIFLSEASRIFDPLGLLTPVTVSIKILLQSLWLQNLTWDEPISPTVANHWLHIRKELTMLSELRISRWLHTNPNTNFQLHGFSDASEKAFAAVVYCRTSGANNSFVTHLMAGKSKVAPLKQVSVPRLELCGALLLSRLTNKIINSLEEKPAEIFLYTDSEIVLNWLSSPPRRWKTFIANRTSEILENSPRNYWKHVRSEENPADLGSRGILPSDLLDNKLWFHGPPWLQQDSSGWPVYNNLSKTNSTHISEDILEERKTFINSFLTETTTSTFDEIVSRFSSWIRLLRTVSYCFRFYQNISYRKNGKEKLSGQLTVAEIKHVETTILKIVQQNSFEDDIKQLRTTQSLQTKSKLIHVTPFFDSNNILRVGGRLKHSELPYETKHPILLPKDHHISRLIIESYHVKYLHAGVNTLSTLLTQDFYIFGSKSMIRKVVHRCMRCFRQKQLTTTQLMGDLPAARVTFTKPFAHVGCDYAGPITLRLSRGRRPKFVKGYISLFVCFATKAIHLELVGDLTSEAFIAALRRFIARRGRCSHLYTDNGTNFKGASRILSEIHKLVLSEQHNATIQNFLSQDNITWSFNPPAAPHFGGLWEAGVKSVKTHLKRVLGNHILTYEELNTVLTQIEGVLNSRPLCILNNHDYEALTPFHLLTGHNYSSLADVDLNKVKVCQLSNWELLTNLLQGFWKSWQENYLTSLQQRPKWCRSEDNIEEGNLVVLKDNNLPPAKWLLARILKLHPGKDGLIRVVTLKTQYGELTRPIVKIVKLPIHS